MENHPPNEGKPEQPPEPPVGEHSAPQHAQQARAAAGTGPEGRPPSQTGKPDPAVEGTDSGGGGGGAAGGGGDGPPPEDLFFRNGRFNRNFLRARRACLLKRVTQPQKDWWQRELQEKAEQESYDFVPSEGLSRGDIGYGEEYALRLSADGEGVVLDTTFVRTKSGRITQSAPPEQLAQARGTESRPAPMQSQSAPKGGQPNAPAAEQFVASRAARK